MFPVCLTNFVTQDSSTRQWEKIQTNPETTYLTFTSTNVSHKKYRTITITKTKQNNYKCANICTHPK